MTSSAFDIEGVTWAPVSPRLIGVRRTLVFVFLGIPLAGSVVAATFVGTWMWLAPAVLAVLLAWLLWLIPRQVRAIGYAELGDDLVIRKGVMFRQLTVVPYGRMQYVEVSAGPLATRARIAEVELHTASAATDASIPGLEPSEADRLRDQLSARGEARLAGL